MLLGIQIKSSTKDFHNQIYGKLMDISNLI